MASLDELGVYLAAQGVGTVGTDLFLGGLPDAPPACVAVLETGGMASAKAMRAAPGSPVAEQPGFQVIARGAPFDYEGPRAKAQLAYRKLDGLGTSVLSGTRWFWVTATQSPFLIQRDENERVWIGFNVLAAKELSA